MSEKDVTIVRMPGIIAAGLAWGILVAVLILRVLPSQSSFQSVGLVCCAQGPQPSVNDFSAAYYQALAGLVIWCAVGLGAFVGFLLKDYAVMIKAFLIAQVVGGVSIVELSAWDPVALIGLLTLLFLIGVLSGLAGVVVADHVFPLRWLFLDWRPLFLGVLAQSVIVVLSVQPVNSGSAALVFPIVILLIGGILAAILGWIRGGAMSSYLSGLFIIASVVLGVISFTGIAYAARVLSISMYLARWGYPDNIVYSGQADVFLALVWLLFASLVIPALVCLRCLYPRPLPPEKMPDFVSALRKDREAKT